MNTLSLRQLRYFVALAQHGHFGRAAAACAISQPALSLQMRQLEETMGAPLLERGARQIRLTLLGEAFALRARQILGLVEELGDLSRGAQDHLRGRLRMGIIPTIAPYLLPTIVAALARGFPELELQLRETVTAKLIEELKEGRLDMAIVALPVSEPALTELPLFSENFVLVRPHHHAELPVPDRTKLRGMRLLLLEEGHCFRDQALSFCDVSSDRPGEWLDGSSLSTLVQMVGAGMGVTLIPDMARAVETRSALVSVAAFEGASPARTIGAIWRKTTPLAHQLAQVAAIVHQAWAAGQRDDDARPSVASV